MSSRSGLGRYGVVASTIVRQPARDDNLVVCPECKHPVGTTKGTHPVAGAAFTDGTLAEHYDGDLLVHGWVCDQHAYEVVIPSRCVGPDAPGMPDGWVGVEIAFTNGTTRYVATPKREFDERGLEP